jgi:DNA-directed RNA polymerase specialized sigma24 family protein
MMPPEECIAIARLRQWAASRAATSNGKATNYRRIGWQQRRASQADAQIVRVIDFERALASLDDEQQMALVLRYRDDETEGSIAAALACSVRKVGYVLPAARRSLAAALERLNLL